MLGYDEVSHTLGEGGKGGVKGERGREEAGGQSGFVVTCMEIDLGDSPRQPLATFLSLRCLIVSRCSAS